jgi:predicted DsbA family dithiol-disulfide isomerase
MQVEIWSDIVCPFCYVGKRRFEAALAGFEPREHVTVTWRSFELDPQAPPEQRGSLDEMLARKYGMSLEQAKAANARVVALAAAEGVTFRLEAAKRGNTFDAHRLIHLAAANGLQGEAKERLLRAYFTEGRAIGERHTLLDLAVEIGLDEQAARDALASDAFAAEVRADERLAHELGIQGVPFFVADRRYAVSGAQEAPTFERLLQRAWQSGDRAVPSVTAPPS